VAPPDAPTGCQRDSVQSYLLALVVARAEEAHHYRRFAGIDEEGRLGGDALHDRVDEEIDGREQTQLRDGETTADAVTVCVPF
jgi:hypothetical protein